MLLLTGGWIFFWVAEGVLASLAWKAVLVQLQVTLIAFLLPSMILFLGEINPLKPLESHPRLRKVLPWILYSVPGVLLVILWWHPASFYNFAGSVDPGTPGWILRIYGPLHGSYRVYSYLMTGVLLPYLLHTMLKPEMRSFLGIKRLIAVFLFAWSGDLLHYFKVIPSPWPQLIFAYALAGSLAVFSSKRYRIFLLAPSALSDIIKIWPQPLVILDEEKKILFHNFKAAALGLSEGSYVGLGPEDLRPQMPDLADILSSSPKIREHQVLHWGGKTFEARSLRFSFNLLGFPGILHYFMDITRKVLENQELELKIAERTSELSELNLRLQDELEHRKKTEKDLYFFSVHDPLTGLVNRGYFQEELSRVMDRLKREPKEHFAVVFVDFDGFKGINDTYGHQTGDLFLQEISQRFRVSVRGSDTVARFGGDEFVILLTNLQFQEEAMEITERILADLSIPLTIRNQRFVPSASLGLVLGTPEYQTPDEVVRDADIAMYHAKMAGKGRISVFTPSMRSALLERAWILEDLRAAMENGGIRLHFQPVVEMETGEVQGYEALVRCLDRAGQEIPPPLLIRAAEESGLSIALGALILRRACETIVALQEKRPQLKDLWISVNAGAQQMADSSFPALAARILEETGLTPSLLHLEITETAIISDFDHVFPVLEKLKALGIHLKLDDFGTGYSSLNYLHRLPADSLKIDRSFVTELGSPEVPQDSRGGAESIIRAIIALGQELGYEIIVEGVETREQVNKLLALGCRYAQGYYYSKPVSVSTLLENHAPKG